MSAETEESEIILQTETETSDINQNSIVTAAPAPLINSSSSAQIVRQPPPRPPPPQISSNRESKPDLIQDSNSDMTQDSNPDMMQDSNPDMMQDSNPGMMQDSNPGLMQDSNPGMMQDSNPGMTQDSNPGMMQDSNPGMTQNSNPGLMQDSNPGTMQDPGLMQDSNPGLMQDSNPDMMQDSNPDMMQDSNPGMMQDPGLMQDSNPGTMQDPGLMQDSNPGMTQNSNLGFTQDSNPDPNRAPSSNQSSESYRKRSGAHLWAAVSYSLSSFSEIRHKADPLFGDSSSQSRGGAEPQPLTDIVPVRPTLEQLRDCTQPPVVLVHGLFGFGPDEMLTPKGRVHYWETAIDRDTNFHGLLVLEASVGPISSYHDRACELFAQIVGCRVDYGEQHSLTHRHDRYGRDFSDKPLYPWWSEDRPLHFVGHSAGGNTIRQLQHLLQLDFWDRGTNASWVKSVTCIMAPMNGSTASYLAGCNVETGLFGLSNIVPLISMVDTLGAAFGFPVNERRRMLLWKLEHFNISQDDFSDFNRLRQRMSESGFLLGEDNLAYDLTLQSCEKFNALVPDFPNTYYLSYTASCSTYTQVKTFMAGPYLYMRNRKFSAMPPGWSWSRDWQISDGLVPLASQMSPSGPLPRTMVCLSVPEESAANAADKSAKSSTNNGEHDSEKIQRGIWYTESMASVAQSVTKHWDHCDVICARGLLWEGIVDRIPVISNGAQALMGLGKRLGRLPKERSSLARVSKAEQRRFYEALYARLSQLE